MAQDSTPAGCWRRNTKAQEVQTGFKGDHNWNIHGALDKEGADYMG